MRRLVRWIRPDITGNVKLATDLLARAAVVRLERGHTPDAVRFWVTQPRQVNRYGPLAMMAVHEVLRVPVRRPVIVLECDDLTHESIGQVCAECDALGLVRAVPTVLTPRGPADAGEISTRLLATVALIACAALAVWTVVATGPAADGRGILAVAIAAALVLTLAIRDRGGAVR